LLVLGVCLAFYPFSVRAWILGMRLHAAQAVVPSWGSFSDVISREQSLPAFILLSALCVAIGVFALGEKRPGAPRISCRSGSVLFSILLLGGIYAFWVRAPVRTYNITAFALIPTLIVMRFGANARGGQFSRRAAYCAMLAIFLWLSVALIRCALVFPFFLRYGMPYAEARDQMRELRQGGGTVEINSGLFTLTEDYSNVTITKVDLASSSDLLLVQQANRGQLAPPAIAGYTLEKNEFSSVQPKLLGVKIANTVCGYNFAVYRREVPAPR
jgi:hypothetical protein